MWILYGDFIYLLRDRFSRWPWRIDADRTLRAEAPSGEDCDPLTAMAAELYHRLFDLSSYAHAADLLGLDRDTADAIQTAADLIGGYNAHVRADLIDAVGLAEMWGLEGRWGDPAFHNSPYPHQWDQPIRSGAPTAGIASAAGRRVSSPCTARPEPEPLAWPHIGSTVERPDAISILFVSCGIVPASCSTFTHRRAGPGSAPIPDRVAAD
jgi:hypothetical protein